MEGGQFILPDLPYAVNELIPYIDAKTMVIHHGKHHAGYTKKLNAALAQAPDLAGKDIQTLLANLPATDESVRTALRNNGGGYYNHCLFWETMSPTKSDPSAELAKAIDRDLGGMDEFKAAFAQAAKSRFGSGWAWLVTDASGKLSISSTPNQDNPLMTGIVEATGSPILGLDVWEHAYYLNYQNRRADYINAWFHLINWQKVSELYAAAIG
ncbi:superoxide dismutase [Sulfuriroseicoccus oceanibius]|uniref:Superoxide dismutase n=1 Tax=Sulfuriroseicoccus oceanibius TaxID=2707525 RepID=A0A6B3L2T0_9BACT|nr:superoxide dismutase [Sulfuriroseicoccus oceanibius]QQL46378.1 superoxide dismutase [Sulfuriroseicoccus oceanibius]